MGKKKKKMIKFASEDNNTTVDTFSSMASIEALFDDMEDESQRDSGSLIVSSVPESVVKELQDQHTDDVRIVIPKYDITLDDNTITLKDGVLEPVSYDLDKFDKCGELLKIDDDYFGEALAVIQRELIISRLPFYIGAFNDILQEINGLYEFDVKKFFMVSYKIPYMEAKDVMVSLYIINEDFDYEYKEMIEELIGRGYTYADIISIMMHLVKRAEECSYLNDEDDTTMSIIKVDCKKDYFFDMLKSDSFTKYHENTKSISSFTDEDYECELGKLFNRYDNNLIDMDDEDDESEDSFVESMGVSNDESPFQSNGEDDEQLVDDADPESVIHKSGEFNSGYDDETEESEEVSEEEQEEGEVGIKTEEESVETHLKEETEEIDSIEIEEGEEIGESEAEMVVPVSRV